MLAVGNPSRGDDALGVRFIEAVAARFAAQPPAVPVELWTDFQLQIEHALDAVDREEVLFVDASVSAAPPFEWGTVSPARDASHSTHALSPSAVLHTCGVVGRPPGRAEVLAIRGVAFELGAPLSEAAEGNLEAALAEFFRRWGA